MVTGRRGRQILRKKTCQPEAEAKLILPRHALHAASIQFKHPLLVE
jgi:hypothetical protein